MKRKPGFARFEGELGAQGKKGVVELSTLLEEPYLKTTHGPQLFERLDFACARTSSASLNSFLVQLGV